MNVANIDPLIEGYAYLLSGMDLLSPVGMQFKRVDELVDKGSQKAACQCLGLAVRALQNDEFSDWSAVVLNLIDVQVFLALELIFYLLSLFVEFLGGLWGKVI